jgi:prevent-host-death family protein
MKEIAIFEFKAKCLGILEEVRKTRRPIRVTRFGEPIADVLPPSPGKPKGRRLGSMAGSGEILGDIVGPTGSLEDWDAWKE